MEYNVRHLINFNCISILILTLEPKNVYANLLHLHFLFNILQYFLFFFMKVGSIIFILPFFF
jgi:hypothetical protein